MKEIHYAIIKGFKCRKTYYFSDGYFGRFGIHESTERLEEVTIFEGMIENPILEDGERVYINDINKTVTIDHRARNLSGGYIYYTNHPAEVIEDEETKRSFEDATAKEKAFLEFEEKKEKAKMDECAMIVTKKWYEFWK